MGVVNPSTPPVSRQPEAGDRLDSWKEIAAYVKRDESTVRRWEAEGLPVHRHAHKKKATVYAYKPELDVWWNDGHSRLEAVATPDAKREHKTSRWATGGIVLLLALGLAVVAVGGRNRILGHPRAGNIASIAVLPLKNLSGDPAQDYFADGMTEALITELGKISALQVLSHQSMNGYRETAKPIPEIAQELKVDALLEGTVLHSGDRVRITTNLVQAVPERHLWAESYEFDRQDVLAVQGEVARDVATRIRIEVTPQEQARLARSRRVDPDAYEAYLLGRAYLLKTPSSTNSARAKDYFEKAIQKDASYAPAYASLAELSLRSRVSPLSDPAESRVQARHWATAALKLDDTLAEAHNALARASQQEWDWAGAEREYRRAIELNPNYSLARIWHSMYLYGMQRFDEAMAEAKRAQHLDPASPFINTWAAAAYLYGGRTEEGLASVQKALELDATHSDASLLIARTYVTHKEYAKAIAQLQRAITLKKDREPLLLGALAHAYAQGGQRDEAAKLVDELKRFKNGVTPFGLIWAYAGLGDEDEAFVWLERAYLERRDRMVWLTVDPLLDPLRTDPRFDRLVHRVGLPTMHPSPSR
jgi:TolB-like protein/Tfp pilus assembly protein PilF